MNRVVRISIAIGCALLLVVVLILGLFFVPMFLVGLDPKIEPWGHIRNDRFMVGWYYYPGTGVTEDRQGLTCVDLTSWRRRDDHIAYLPIGRHCRIHRFELVDSVRLRVLITSFGSETEYILDLSQGDHLEYNPATRRPELER